MTRRANADYGLRATDESKGGFDSFNRRLDKTERNLQDFSTRSATGLAEFGTKMLAVTAGVAGGMTLALRQITAVSAELDELNKTARTLGIATEVMTGLRHVANLAGADFAVVQRQMGRIAEAARQAADGNKKLSGVFKELGINAQGFAKLDATDQLLLLAEAFRGGGGFRPLGTKPGEIPQRLQGEARAMHERFFPEDRTQRMTQLRALFGARGAEAMGRLFEGGAGGIARGLSEARQLGLTRTGPEGQAAEDLQDAVTRLGGAWQGLNESMRANVAVVEPLTKLFNRMASDISTVTRVTMDAEHRRQYGPGLAGIALRDAGRSLGLFSRLINPLGSMLEGGPGDSVALLRRLTNIAERQLIALSESRGAVFQ